MDRATRIRREVAEIFDDLYSHMRWEGERMLAAWAAAQIRRRGENWLEGYYRKMRDKAWRDRRLETQREKDRKRRAAEKLDPARLEKRRRWARESARRRRAQSPRASRTDTERGPTR